jgi:myo-inositol-1(or 4)-monophosphatase
MMEIAADAASAAGNMLKAGIHDIQSVERKADSSLVTDLDAKAETCIIGMIRNHFPDHAIMGEESGRLQSDSEWLWIVDPLDGTHNFIRGLPLYGVSIGIARGNELVAGVIYLPYDGLLYTAEKGSGAFRNGEKISASSTVPLSRCTMSFDSGIRYDLNTKTRVLAALAPKVFNIRMLGASSILLTLIADGRLDLAVEFDDKPWDFAAGAVIISEAGGRITDFEGGVLTPDSHQYVAANPAIQPEVLAILQQALHAR